jgi:alkylhydroperoxidase/carboxymuconolactone decarboxylase family protein YurZ
MEMTMEDSARDGDAILRRIQDQRGHVWPLHRLMAELDPGFLDLFDKSYRHTLGFDPLPGDGSLDIKYRELVCACACAMAPAPEDVTVHHLQRAFDAGLSEREAIDGFHALLIPAGGVAVCNGVRALLRMREESGSQNGL